MTQQLAITFTKAGETGSPISVPVERVTYDYKRNARPFALPRLQTINVPVPEPIVAVFDIGFMTQTINLQGTCSDALKDTLRGAILNWYRHQNTATELSYMTLTTKEAAYTGNFGPCHFTKVERNSQTYWSFNLNFLVRQRTASGSESITHGLWGWGFNDAGQLGRGTITATEPTPALIAAMPEMLAVVGGVQHSMALASGGNVWTWGINAMGQLGDGTNITRSSPIRVIGPAGVGFLDNIVSIASGWNTCVAVDNDGTAWAWGEVPTGYPGLTQVTTPTHVVGSGGVGLFSDIAQAAVDNLTVLFRRTDGTVWGYGGNGSGQLGIGNNITQSYPVQTLGPGGVGFLTDIMYLALNEATACAIRTDGTIWMWGEQNSGNFGDPGFVAGTSYTARQVPGLTGFVQATGGWAHVIARHSDGTVWAWGENGQGQLGDGTIVDKNVPFQIAGLSNIIQIGAGYDASLAIDSAGAVWAWGRTRLAGSPHLVPTQVAGIPVAQAAAIAPDEHRFILANVV